MPSKSIDNCARLAAAIYSLIGSAKLHVPYPELYVRTVLAQIGDHPISRIKEIRTWNVTPSLRTLSYQAA